MKKYKQPGETFYCLAWTTVYLDFDTDKKRKGNLIAAGGFQNDIKIIEPNQLVCFEEIQGHKGVLECLMFHPHHPTWLLSAAVDIAFIEFKVCQLSLPLVSVVFSNFFKHRGKCLLLKIVKKSA